MLVKKLPVSAGDRLAHPPLAATLGERESIARRSQRGGRGVRRKRLAVGFPCHRVVKKDGALSGYRWGVNRKRALLKKEAYA